MGRVRLNEELFEAIKAECRIRSTADVAKEYNFSRGTVQQIQQADSLDGLREYNREANRRRRERLLREASLLEGDEKEAFLARYRISTKKRYKRFSLNTAAFEYIKRLLMRYDRMDISKIVGISPRMVQQIERADSFDNYARTVLQLAPDKIRERDNGGTGVRKLIMKALRQSPEQIEAQLCKLVGGSEQEISEPNKGAEVQEVGRKERGEDFVQKVETEDGVLEIIIRVSPNIKKRKLVIEL